jgi:hypothetical protein
MPRLKLTSKEAKLLGFVYGLGASAFAVKGPHHLALDAFERVHGIKITTEDISSLLTKLAGIEGDDNGNRESGNQD